MTLCIADLDPRLQSRIRIEDSGHWIWTGAFMGKGYGMFRGRIGSRRGAWLAHRLVYAAMVGEIPDDLQLDHLCRNHACVSPHHLEPVTSGENTRRGENWNRRKEACLRGHRFTPENTYINTSGAYTLRQCRACMRLRAATKRSA